MMKAVRLLFIIFFVSLWGTGVSAQVIDMRAYSRQRGFKPYHARTSAPAQSRSSAAATGQKRQTASAGSAQAGNVQTGESEQKGDKKSAASSAQTAEMQEYIRNNPQVRPDI
ncbi:MAG: hypothetical protein ACI4TE_08485 [Alphaproteobacteria bacterium]